MGRIATPDFAYCHPQGRFAAGSLAPLQTNVLHDHNIVSTCAQAAAARAGGAENERDQGLGSDLVRPVVSPYGIPGTPREYLTI